MSGGSWASVGISLKSNREKGTGVRRKLSRMKRCVYSSRMEVSDCISCQSSNGRWEREGVGKRGFGVRGDFEDEGDKIEG